MSDKRMYLLRADGTDTIVSPCMKDKKNSETMEEFLSRNLYKGWNRFDEDGNIIESKIVIEHHEINLEDIPENRLDRDCWKFDPEDKKVKVCAVKKAEKEAKKVEKENKKNLLKSKLKLTDEELKILKSML